MLENIHSPHDLLTLTYPQLRTLTHQIRQKIISVVSQNGGHLASNLGVVELTIALHRAFQSPHDAFVWDVSHQTYTHKLLTGRLNQFETLRQKNGISGFSKQKESEHDFFDLGHSSTSISGALGLLAGRALQNHTGKTIAIIGDGSLTGGMAFEALSHAGHMGKNLIVVLNDNQMSISENTGSLSKHLSKITMTPSYQSFRYVIDRFVKGLPFVGNKLTDLIFRFKRAVKGLLYKNNLFVDLGFEYVGPLNGHNIAELESVFNQVKKLSKPVVVHVITQKGRGYTPAENDPMFFHGIGQFSVIDGTVEKSESSSFTESFAKSIVDLGETDKKIVCITAAMAKGTGLSAFAQKFPSRFFDVGIAESHAVTFAGGLAKAGMKPVVAIYSTFMQRAVDQVVHDVALQGFSIVFMLDRCGAVPDDGETHQGIFDIAFFRAVPNVTILAPASGIELDTMLKWAITQEKTIIIRYPKTTTPKEIEAFNQPIEEGRGIFVQKTGKNAKILFVCTGSMYSEVLEASRLLLLKGLASDIYSLRFIKPLDTEYFVSITQQYTTVVFVEDGVKIGGISEYSASLIPHKKVRIHAFGDTFVPQGKRNDILETAGLNPENLIRDLD